MKTKENLAQSLSTWKKDLAPHFVVKPSIYWLDLMICVLLGYGSFLAVELFALPLLAQIPLFLLSVFAFYRAVLFTHELTHQDRSTLPGFSLAWNLLIGIPLMAPSFMYRGVHLDHHKKNSYSTKEDGEYIPFGALPFWRTAFYLFQSIYLPFILMLRFGVIGPLSLFHPRLRREVMEKASSLAIRFDAVRKVPTGIDLRNWYVQEALAFLFVATSFYLLLTGVIAWSSFFHYYAVSVAMLFVNALRTVIAHRYLNANFQELSYEDQLLDSVNLEGNPLVGELLAPVGLRFHALHHIFPSMPYHSLEAAHKALRQKLPADSFYHLTVEPSFLSALVTLWNHSNSSERSNQQAAS